MREIDINNISTDVLERNPELLRVDESISEEDFHRWFIKLAHRYRWLIAHFRTVRVQKASGEIYYQTPIQADGKGFPDDVLVRERVIFVELKSNTGRLSQEQKLWKEAIERAGYEYHVIKPKDTEHNARKIIEILK